MVPLAHEEQVGFVKTYSPPISDGLVDIIVVVLQQHDGLLAGPHGHGVVGVCIEILMQTWGTGYKELVGER